MISISCRGRFGQASSRAPSPGLPVRWKTGFAYHLQPPTAKGRGRSSIGGRQFRHTFSIRSAVVRPALIENSSKRARRSGATGSAREALGSEMSRLISQCREVFDPTRVRANFARQCCPLGFRTSTFLDVGAPKVSRGARTRVFQCSTAICVPRIGGTFGRLLPNLGGCSGAVVGMKGRNHQKSSGRVETIGKNTDHPWEPRRVRKLSRFWGAGPVHHAVRSRNMAVCHRGC